MGHQTIILDIEVQKSPISEDYQSSTSDVVSKQIGSNISVHVDNLCPPHETRKVRDLDPVHVKELEEQFLKSRSLFCVLVGYIPTKRTSLSNLASPGSGQVETIGGNHTRQALQNLHKQGKCLHITHVNVNIYEALTNIEAMQLGFMHNEQHEHSKACSFEEKVKLFRKLYLSAKEVYPKNEKKCASHMRDQVAHVLGIERERTKNVVQIHMQCASQPNEIWELLLQFFEMWRRGEITDQPKNTPLRQTHVTFFMFKRNVEERRIILEDIIYRKKAFRPKRKQSSDGELMATETSIKEKQTFSDEHLKKLEETCAVLNLKNKEEENKCKQLKKKIKDMELQLENDKTANALEIAKQEIDDLHKVIENMTNTQAASTLKMNELKKENAELRYQIKDIEERILHAEEAASRARLELHKENKDMYCVRRENNKKEIGYIVHRTTHRVK